MSTATYYYIYNCSRYTRYNPTTTMRLQLWPIYSLQPYLLHMSTNESGGESGHPRPLPPLPVGGGLSVLSAGADPGFVKGGAAGGSRDRPPPNFFWRKKGWACHSHIPQQVLFYKFA